MRYLRRDTETPCNDTENLRLEQRKRTFNYTEKNYGEKNVFQTRSGI